MIIGLYLILPLLRLWVKKCNKKYVEYFIILALIFTFFIPQIITIGSKYSDLFEHANEIVEYINLKYVGGYTTYFILGWYLNNFEIKRKKVVYYLGIISAIVTIVGTYILSASAGKPVRLYGNLMLNVFFQSLCTFVFVKSRMQNKKMKENKLVSVISQNSLGIYAMHAMIVTVLFKIINKIQLNIAIIVIPTVFMVVLITSIIGTQFFRRLSVLRKVV